MRKFSAPIASIVDRPIAESMEYRPPTQSQNSNMLRVSMPNSETFAALVETATKCLATALASPPSAWSDQSRAAGVGHRFQRRKGLRGDDKKRFRRVQVAGRFRQVRAVNIGDEAEGDRTLTVEFEGFISHHRPQVGAADADVDHVADALARMALPVATADLAGEIRHLVQHGVDLGRHIFAVHDDRRISRRPKATCSTRGFP